MGCPKVSIVILNWNGWKETVVCLESVFKTEYPQYEVIVVDNGSNDDSINRLKDYCAGRLRAESEFVRYEPEGKPIDIFIFGEQGRDHDNALEIRYRNLPPDRRLKVISKEHNSGYSGGNNEGIMHSLTVSKADYILLINNDTDVASDFLEQMMSVAMMSVNAGIIGPKIMHQCIGKRRDIISSVGCMMEFWGATTKPLGANQVDVGQFERAISVDYVSGACMLIRRGVLEEIGLLDSKFFLYWEENDFCMRARRAGFEVLVAPKSKIWHKIHSSTDSHTYEYYHTRNMFWFMRKHATRTVYSAFLAYCIALMLPRRIGSLVLRGEDASILSQAIRGIVDGVLTSIK